MKEVNDLLKTLGELEDAPLIWINEKVYDMAQEIKRLKEDYMILQNASDEVEEEKDKEIEKLKADIYEAWDNSTWWRNRYNAIVKQNDDNHKKLVKEQEKIEKATKYIEEQSKFIGGCDIYRICNKDVLLDILKGVDKE